MENEKQWYVVNTYSGHEEKVKHKLDMRAESMDMHNNIFRVIVPKVEVEEIKDGQVKKKMKKFFPGYILVEMIMSDEAWYVVRNTDGVTGFIGSSGKGAKPTPLLPEEVDRILTMIGEKEVASDGKIEKGSKVNILTGPVSGMSGIVKDISDKVLVGVDLFGQETDIEVDMDQLELASY